MRNNRIVLWTEEAFGHFLDEWVAAFDVLLERVEAFDLYRAEAAGLHDQLQEGWGNGVEV